MELASEHKDIDLDRIADIAEYGDHNWRILEAARMYTSAGLWVLPLRKGSKILPSKEHGLSYGNASNKRTTVEKWFGEGGRYQGWNIGIATGKDGGTFAIDVDRHGKADGLEELDKLEAEYGRLNPGPIQETPNGGRHYLFVWQDNATSSTGKIAKSIDTRGGTDTACKGHIVAWPSVVDGKQYKWIRGGNRPAIDKWVLERMGVPWKPKGSSASNRGNENVGIEDLEPQLEKDQIKRMLAKIDPNDMEYDDWLRIGMAIKSQYPGEDGFEMWDGWSERGARYESNECHIRWSGLDELGAVRIGTLFHFAKGSGWEAQKEDKHSNPIKDIIHTLNDEYAVVVVGGKLKILREHKHYDPVFGHYDLMDKESFRGLMQPFKVEIINGKGKSAMVSKGDIWLGDEERRTYPNGMECVPDGKIRPGVYNTWSGFSCKPVKGDCSLWLDHVLNIVCAGNKDHYEWMVDWCAYAVQFPGELPGTCIVMRGDEGTGKGIVANTIGEFFGPHFRHLIDNTHLLSNFNAHMMDATFVFADEITYGGEVKTAGKLKGMVTEKYLVGERKGIDAVGYKNMIHLMIASNSDWVIPTGPKSRRWFILDVSNAMANNRAYFNKLMDQIKSGGKEALLHYLLTRNITCDLRKAPGTKALEEQTARTVDTYNTVVRWWTRKILEERLESMDLTTDVVGDNKGTDWPKVVKTSDIVNEYSAWCKDTNARSVSDFVFYGSLRKFGFVATRPSIQGSRVRALKVPTVSKAKAAMKKLGYTIIEDDEDFYDDTTDN